MKRLRIGSILLGILVIFLLSMVSTSCATTSVSQSDLSSRRSLMMRENVDRSKAKKVNTAKASRSYKKSKKRSDQYKKKKHKYKKRR